jgi:dihydrodipicolinate reductase
MRFAAEAARHLPHVEIIELHHDRKVDAPSGTALRTAELIAEARAEVPEVPLGDDRHPGARGPTTRTCGSTASGCPASWPTRRSSSVARVRR